MQPATIADGSKPAKNAEECKIIYFKTCNMKKINEKQFTIIWIVIFIISIPVSFMVGNPAPTFFYFLFSCGLLPLLETQNF